MEEKKQHFLFSPEQVSEQPSLAQFVHGQFRALTLDHWFPCLGAKSAIRRGTYLFAMYFELASSETTALLDRDLRRFIQEYVEQKQDFTTFVASFASPASMDEQHFERLLWQQLQMLHEQDEQTWCLDIPCDPNDANFAFSFGGHTFFIVGLHAGSSRWARRFAWTTLIFNAHQQFEHLRERGKFERLQRQIRVKDSELQGGINPNLLAYHGRSAARQYAGRFVEEDWACPFHARQDDRQP
jgi:FPC/CPF motif-containing protein YcgG